MHKLVYLAGAMTGLSYENANNWRDNTKTLIESSCDLWKVFNPVEHFNDWQSQNSNYVNDAEPMKFDLWKLHESNLVIVNLGTKSIGTSCEIAIAYDNRIPIIGYCPTWESYNNLHPWLKKMCLRVFTDYDEMLSYFFHHFGRED